MRNVIPNYKYIVAYGKIQLYIMFKRLFYCFIFIVANIFAIQNYRICFEKKKTAGNLQTYNKTINNT